MFLQNTEVMFPNSSLKHTKKQDKGKIDSGKIELSVEGSV